MLCSCSCSGSSGFLLKWRQGASFLSLRKSSNLLNISRIKFEISLPKGISTLELVGVTFSDSLLDS